MKKIWVLAILLCLFGCRAKQKSLLHGDLTKAFDILEEDGREGAYVVAEDPVNQNYVQFAIMEGDWIHFDIPNFIDEAAEFDPVQNWKVVTELPNLEKATRRHFIDPPRATELWEFLVDAGFAPYYFWSVYEQSFEVIAATESICFNVPRSDRDKCLLAVSRVFEIIYGYPIPEKMEFISDQTSWASPP